jgi:hypothetical protein
MHLDDLPAQRQVNEGPHFRVVPRCTHSVYVGSKLTGVLRSQLD